MAVLAKPLPPQPDGVPWPTARWPTGAARADQDRLAALVDGLFADPGAGDGGDGADGGGAAESGPPGHTDALAVVQGGRVVLERYGERHVGELELLAGIEPGPITAEDRLASWSMAKSVLHAVIGILVDRGAIAIDDRAPVPEWDDPDDPRHAITWRQLLEMRPGLTWLEEYYDASGGFPDVINMLYGDGQADMAGFAAGFALAHAPGSAEAYNYSSGTTNILAAAVQRVLGAGETAFREFLAEALFEPLGMASAEPTFDAAGTWVASSSLAATAQDYARFGLLYLRGGRWGDRQILSEAWVDTARVALSPDDPAFHSMHWWVLPDDPRGTFMCRGFEGQRIIAVPAADLVLVRLGKTHTDIGPALDAHLDAIIGCFTP